MVNGNDLIDLKVTRTGPNFSYQHSRNYNAATGTCLIMRADKDKIKDNVAFYSNSKICKET